MSEWVTISFSMPKFVFIFIGLSLVGYLGGVIVAEIINTKK